MLIRKAYVFPRPEVDGMKEVERVYLELLHRKRDREQLDPEEEDWMDYLIWDYATQKVREHWNWITVPLMVEKERSKIITKTEGSWADMEACGFVKGV